jgi:hypothetical protein
VDRPEAGTVARSHVLVERVHGVRARELAVLLVHVVRARARVVANPDAEVLHLERLLLEDLGEAKYAREGGQSALPFRLPLAWAARDKAGQVKGHSRCSRR